MPIGEMKSRIKALCYNAEKIIKSNTDKAQSLVDEAFLKANKINDEEDISRCLLLFGMLYLKKNDLCLANEYFERCLNYCYRYEDFEVKFKALKNLGNLRMEVNDFDSALEYYFSCLDIISSENISCEEKGSILIKLGIIYKELEQYNIARDYLYQAIEISSEKCLNKCISKIYSYISECYIYEGELEKAQKYVLKAIDTSVEGLNEYNLGYAYLVYAKYNYEINNYNKSKLLFEKSINKFSQLNENSLLAEAMTEYGVMLYNINKFKEAELILDETSLVLLNIKNYKIELKVYFYLAKIYEGIGNYEKAFNYFKRYNEMKTINDEIWKTIKVKNIISKHEYLKTDIKVKELTTTNENLVTLSSLGREITSTLNKIDIIEKVSKSIFQLINCDSFGIGFINKTKRLDYYIIHEGYFSEKTTISIENSTRYFAALIKESQQFINNNFCLETIRSNGYSVNGLGLESVKSLMSCTLIFEKQVIGLINVQKNIENAFNDNDLEMLRILSYYISIALNNSMQSEELIDTNIKLKELTEKDGLTKIFNRYSLDINSTQIIKKGNKLNKPFSIIMIDVDFFKEYNDNYGHMAGDDCLVNISKVLNKVCEHEDSYIYRYGGDEFLIILLDRDINETKRITQRIREEVMNLNIEHLYSKCSNRVTLTIGIATILSDTCDYNSIFALADKALYIAKNRGRNNVNQLIYK